MIAERSNSAGDLNPARGHDDRGARTVTSASRPVSSRAIAATPVTRPFCHRDACRAAAGDDRRVAVALCVGRNVTAVDCFPPTRQPNVQYPHCVASQPCELRAIGDHS